MSKLPFKRFALQRSPAGKAVRGEGAPTYLIELTRFGARVRVAGQAPDGTAVSRSPKSQASLMIHATLLLT
jgi:hypothetical protein